MRAFLITLTIGLIATSINAANFIIPGNPAYEPFANATGSGGTAYAAGSTLAGQTNAQGLAWVQAGTNNPQPTLASGTLSYPGLLADTGNSVSFGGNIAGDFARWDFASTLGGTNAITVYYSMLLNITNLGGDTSGGVFICGFNNSSGFQTGNPTVVPGRLLVRTNGGGGYNLGINKGDGTAADYFWSPANCTTNTTYFVVGAYTFSGTPASGNDSVSIWVNPSSSTFGGSAPTPDATSAGSGDNGGANIGTTASADVIASFLFREALASEPYAIASELSVGLTWADVTPLPAGSLTPVFTNLVASTNTTYGTAVSLSGQVVAPGPVYPTNGEAITVTVNGIQESSSINDSTGDFLIDYEPENTPISQTPYTITYAYKGNISLNLASATNTSTTLYITNPLPVVLNGGEPFNGSTTVSAGILYVSNAVGSDVVTVASGTGTLAGTNVGPELITNFGTLALGGTAATNYTLTGASGSVTIAALPLVAGGPIFEPFAEPLGNLPGGTNAQGYTWYAAGSGAGGEPTVIPGTLSVPGLAPDNGNSVTYGGDSGITARLDLGLATTNSTFYGASGLTVYYSMSFDVTSLGGLTATPSIVAGFNNTAGAQSAQPSVIGARLYTALSGSGYILGINKADGVSNDIAWDTNTFTANETNFIVAAYTFSGTPGQSNDSVSLWVNPSSSTFGGATAPTPDATTSAGNNMGSTSVSDVIASFLLREASALEPVMTVDELSVGVTWADVTPPASVPVTPFRISGALDASKSNFILSWTSVSGASYQVLSTTNVAAARSTWTRVGSPITASGTNTSATNAISGTKTFFGVVSP